MNRQIKGLLVLRSALFTVVLYVNWAIFFLLGSWTLFGPRRIAMAGFKLHGRVSVWWLRAICGTRMEVRGREHLLSGPVIVASKHQAAWDTFALVWLMRDPALVLKAELLSIPFYGWFCRKLGMIAIRREAGPAALRLMAREAKDRAAAGREIMIFPEGTRQLPGTPPAYRSGVALLYEELGLSVCPVALNSGVYWPRHSMLRYPGAIVVEFLPPIPPGLPRREFMARLEATIEVASNRLLSEALADLKAQGYDLPQLRRGWSGPDPVGFE